MAHLSNHLDKVYKPNKAGIAKLKNVGIDPNNFFLSSTKKRTSNVLYEIPCGKKKFVPLYSIPKNYHCWESKNHPNVLFATHPNVNSTLFVQKTCAGYIKTHLQETAFIQVFNSIFFNGDLTPKVNQYLSTQPQFRKMLISQSHALKKYLGETKIHCLVKDSSDLFINKVARKLIKNTTGIFSHKSRIQLDKWNPADFWIIFDPNYRQKVTSCKTLAELNSYLKKSLQKKQGIVGCSLKHGLGKLSEVNVSKKIPLDIHDIYAIVAKKEGLLSKSCKIYVEGKSGWNKVIQVRVFKSDPIYLALGEIVKASGNSQDARHGKFSLCLLGDDLMSKIYALRGGILQLCTETNTISLNLKKYKIAQECYYEIIDRARFGQFNYDEYFSDDGSTLLSYLKDEMNGMADEKIAYSINQRLNSKLQVLAVLSCLSSATEEERTYLIDKCIRYGSSQSEWSSPHLKLQ